MGLKENIKKKRNEFHMTLEELGKKVGVSRQTIQRYENGVISNIPSDKIRLMANALNTTPQYLMGWVDNDKCDTLLDYYFDTIQKIICLLEENGYSVLESDSNCDNTLIIKKNGNLIKVISKDDLLHRYEEQRENNITSTVSKLLNDNDDSQIHTIAAHFDGDEYTEEELEEIRQFAEFVKSRKK